MTEAGVDVVAPTVQWEYTTLVKHMGSMGWSTSGSSTDSTGGISLQPISSGSELSRVLNRMGSDGWELSMQIGDELVFKRLSRRY